MPGPTSTSADLDVRRRRILFRAWHRGIREMDMIMGRFAEARLRTMTDSELDIFELLIEVPDRDLFSWIASGEEVPANYDTDVFRALCAFHRHDAPVHS
jgi:antitoxin CptB